MAGAARTRWFWLSLGIVVADRATKFAIERYTPGSFRRTIVRGFIYLVHSQNPGMAFGLLAEGAAKWVPWLLSAISAVVIAVLAWLLAAGRAGGRLGQSGLALILGGAAGNLIDRLLHGGVTDFLEVWLGSYRWPAFNVADSAISIGAALVALELFFGPRRRSEEGLS
ncbi:MAG: signal peptidase II [Acidobacteria bacterium]|nr:signal peptidase II [Acidobacteriota bacterium]